MRALLLIFTISIALVCRSQEPKPALLQFSSAFPLTHTEQKMVYSALTGVDPEILISISKDADAIKVLPSQVLSPYAISHALSAYGVIVNFIDKGHSSERSVVGDFPWASQDPDLERDDPVQYQLNKEMWINAHPAEYEELITQPDQE